MKAPSASAMLHANANARFKRAPAAGAGSVLPLPKQSGASTPGFRVGPVSPGKVSRVPGSMPSTPSLPKVKRSPAGMSEVSKAIKAKPKAMPRGRSGAVRNGPRGRASQATSRFSS